MFHAQKTTPIETTEMTSNLDRALRPMTLWTYALGINWQTDNSRRSARLWERFSVLHGLVLFSLNIGSQTLISLLYGHVSATDGSATASWNSTISMINFQVGNTAVHASLFAFVLRRLPRVSSAISSILHCLPPREDVYKKIRRTFLIGSVILTTVTSKRLRAQQF